LFLRCILLLAGILWIPVEIVSRNRGRVTSSSESWAPKKGDIIISNWVSWIEIVWLKYRFDPIFVKPIFKTNSGSSLRLDATNAQLVGFVPVSWVSLIRLTGHTPALSSSLSAKSFSLKGLARQSNRPIVVFPELTTSNGRALLKFAPVFGEQKVPSRDFRTFVMCVRYDSPTPLRPGGVHSIPSFLNPLYHCFMLCKSLSSSAIFSVRLLAPSSSPSSGDFLASEVIHQPTIDELSEACAFLVAQIGRLKRVQKGWEDKAKLLQLYKSRRY